MSVTSVDIWSERFLVAFGIFKFALILVFFLSFQGVAESSEEPGETCKGNNLITQLEAENPGSLAKMREEAQEISNTGTVLWKVEGKADKPSYLFGTMHMADPEIVAMPEKTRSALESSSTIVVESTDALNQATATKAMMSLAHLTLLGEGQTLSGLVREDLHDELEAAVGARGLPMMLANRMQPWIIATTIALPACELARKKSGARVLDQVIADHAEKAGKELKGLETISEQFTAMASLPQEFHVNALENTLEMGTQAEDLIETLKYLYLTEETGLIWPLMKVMSPQSYSAEGSQDFQRTLIDDRNLLMAERSQPMLDEGGAFIAVGTLHLPGETGLVKLLRDKGYTVSAVN